MFIKKNFKNVPITTNTNMSTTKPSTNSININPPIYLKNSNFIPSSSQTSRVNKSNFFNRNR